MLEERGYFQQDLFDQPQSNGSSWESSRATVSSLEDGGVHCLPIAADGFPFHVAALRSPPCFSSTGASFGKMTTTASA